MTTSFIARLRDNAAAKPDDVALTCGEVSLTRAELVAQASRLAVRMAELGVGQGDTVTIGLPNSVEAVLSMVATWWLGATPQPVSHRLPAIERRAIIELAAPKLIVGVPTEEAAGSTVLSAAELTEAVAMDQLAPPPDAIAPVWKTVTSGGSTGRPKLIVATQPAEVENVAGLGALLRFPTDGVVLVTGPLSHNAPFVVATVGLLFGNHVVVMPRFDALETLQLVEKFAVRWLYLVPTMMTRIWRLPDGVRLGHDMSSLEVAFHMAAPCPEWLKRAWIDWLGPESVLELYTGTELQAMTVITGSEWLDHPGSVGRPVLGEIEVRDEDGRPVPTGTSGELWMRRGPDQPSPYSYLGATAKAANDGWESLGDLGYFDADGYLYLNDRLTDMIVVGGSNVYPAEVEAALDEHPAVRSSCVIGLPDDDLGNAVHALIDVVGDATDDELRIFLHKRLAPHKVPRTFERVTEPLRDDAGKVRRSALRAERVNKRFA
jgi:bile acid-coenzyme A ligase